MSVTEYGLIGHPLAHSLSPHIHESLMASAGIKGIYRLFDIRPEQFDKTVKQLVRTVSGLNCTIPYKERVIGHLEVLDRTARRIGAVNTIHGQTGYNTDYLAFRDACPLQAVLPVLILGAGGVSRTLALAAAEAGCHIWITARRPDQAEKLAVHIRHVQPGTSITVLQTLNEWRILVQNQVERGIGKKWVLLNGTPVGLWPHVSEMPVDAKDLDDCAMVYDTIYNPLTTKLVLMARERNIPAEGGLSMLFGQAVQAQKIWHPAITFNDRDCSMIRQNLKCVLLNQSPVTLLLTGFMGSGKTTIGRLLAKRLNWRFLDLDTVIEKQTGQSIPDLFASRGEAAFRKHEMESLREVLSQPVCQVLATGGGALIQPEAAAVCRSNRTFNIFLDISLDRIRCRIGGADGRPMLSQQSAEHWLSLYQARYPRYQSMADLTIQADQDPEEIVRIIIKKLGLEEQI